MWLIVALMLDRVQLKLCSRTYGSAYCGYGTIDAVNQRKAESPMAYRVLVPWIIGLVEWLFPRLKAHRLPALYEPTKIGLMALALWAVEAAIGLSGALLFAAMVAITFYFDYFDWAAEVLGLALALTGRVEWALIGGIVLALSRETAPLVAVVYGLETGDIGRALQVLSAILAVLLAVRLWAGFKPLYCDRFMWRMNVQDVRGLLCNRPFYSSEIFMSIMVTALTFGVIVTGRAGASWPVPLALLIAGWLMARAAETRVFVGCLIWVAMGIA